MGLIVFSPFFFAFLVPHITRTAHTKNFINPKHKTITVIVQTQTHHCQNSAWNQPNHFEVSFVGQNAGSGSPEGINIDRTHQVVELKLWNDSEACLVAEKRWNQSACLQGKKHNKSTKSH